MPRLTDEDCQACGAENPCWFTESELWNAATAHGAPYGKNSILCPQCFVRLFVENTGNDPAWQLVPDRVTPGGLMSDVWTRTR